MLGARVDGESSDCQAPGPGQSDAVCTGLQPPVPHSVQLYRVQTGARPEYDEVDILALIFGRLENHFHGCHSSHM